MAIITQPDFLPSAFASDGDANVIPANNDGTAGLASFSKGFPLITEQPLANGGLPPQRADFNGILKMITQFLVYIQNGGLFTYNAAFDYPVGSIVIYNNLLYFCIKENGANTGNGTQAPTQDSYWSPVAQGFIDNVFSGNNTFSGNNIFSGKNTLSGDNTLSGNNIISVKTLTAIQDAVINLVNSNSVTAPDPEQMNEVVTLQYLINYVQTNAMVIGDIAYRPYVAPGWVKANGATVNRSDYPNLVTFADTHSLWTSNPSANPGMYGNGDGSTTFVLPDLRNLFLEGGDAIGYKSAGLPNITGWINIDALATQSTNKGDHCGGAFSYVDYGQYQTRSGAARGAYRTFSFDASNSSSVYGESTTVQPESVVLIPQIKY